jgi:hypothetical protein
MKFKVLFAEIRGTSCEKQIDYSFENCICGAREHRWNRSQQLFCAVATCVLASANHENTIT